MLETMYRLLQPPVFDNKVESTTAKFLNWLLLCVFVTVGLGVILLVSFAPSEAKRLPPIIFFTISIIFLKFLLNRYHLRLASYLTVILIWITVTLSCLTFFGVYEPIIVIYILVILLAGILLDKRSTIIAPIICTITTLGIIFLMRQGLVMMPEIPFVQLEFIGGSYALIFIVTGLLVYIGKMTIIDALQQAQRNERDFMASQKRLRAIASSLPDRAVILDADGYYSDILKPDYDTVSIGTRFGGTKDTHLRDVASFPKSFVDFCIQKVREAIDADETLMFEYDFPDSAENLIYTLEGRAVPFTDPISGTKQVIWLSRNITDRKHTEKALIESDKLFKAVIRALPDRTLIFDYEGRYQEILKPEYSLIEGAIGIHNVEIGQPIHNFFPKEFADFCLEMIRKTVDSGEMQNFDYPSPTSYEARYYEARTIPFNDPQTGAKRVLWIARDITERKQTENALINGEKLLRTVVSAFPDRTLIFDRQGHYKEIIKSIHSLSNHDITNYDIELEHTLHEYFPKEFADFCLQKIQKTLDAGTIQIFDYPVSTAGKTYYFEARTLPFRDPRTGTEQVLWITRDVTEKKEAERNRLDLALEQQKLEFFRQFVDNMTHDLKTPLAGIVTNLYLLERIHDEDGRKQRANNIKQQVSAIEQMIDDMLMVSRLDSIPELQFKTVDIVPLIEEALIQLRPKAEQKTQHLDAEFAPESVMVQASDKELSRALTNLIENAIKYTPDQGHVTVRLYSNKTEIIAEIKDTGIGMHPNEIPHIFERFYRTDSGKGTAAGTGLGLTIVHRIIELHGGKIEVESEANQGSVFRLRLPVA